MIKPPRLEHISLPLKGTKEVEWVEGLRSTVTQMGEDFKVHESAFCELNKLRQDCRGCPATSVGLEILVRYYRQIDSLSKRLPLTEHPLPVQFVWFDSFDAACSVKQSSLAYEKANILYNIGAAFSNLCQGKDTSKNLQAAASVFTFIAENFLHAPLNDISPDSLLCLSQIMLAQAQEFIVLAAFDENKSLKTISKLAASASSLFRDARNRINDKNDLQRWFSRLYPSNCKDDAYTILRTKASLWGVLTDYIHGEAAYSENNLGEALSRLKYAQKYCEEIKESFSMNVQGNISQCIQQLSSHLPSRIVELEKENGLIFNQPVPDRLQLPATDGISLVKIRPLQECLHIISPSPDLFKKLVPLRVHEEISKYSEEKSKLLRYENLKVTSADSDLQTLLTSLGFPASLERLNGQEASKSLLKELECLKANACEVKKNLSGIDSRLQGSFAESENLLKTSMSELENEMNKYQKYKLTYGSQWKQTESYLLNNQYYSKIENFQMRYKSLYFKYNEMVASLSRNSQKQLNLLTGPMEDLNLILPRNRQQATGGAKEFHEEIMKKLDILENLRKDRNGNLEHLKDLILKDDITDDLSLVRSQDTMAVFHRELAKFDDPCKAIEDNIVLHNAAIEDFKESWEKTIIQTGYHEYEAQWQQFLQEFKTALNELTTYFRNLHELEKEVVDFVGNLERLHREIFEFASKRTLEGEDFERSMQISSANEGNSILIEKIRALSVKNLNENQGKPSPEQNTRNTLDPNPKSFPKTLQKDNVSSKSNNKSQPTFEPSLLD